MKKFLPKLTLLSAATQVSLAAVPPTFEPAWQQIDVAPRVSFHMVSRFADVNADGCLDLFIGSHKDDLPSSMHTQNNPAAACLGLFTYVPNDNNYSQPVPKEPRATSRHSLQNLTGNPDGLLSILGQDVDLGTSALYQNIGSDSNGQPLFGPKVRGCYLEACIPTDLNADGVFDYVSSSAIRDPAGALLQAITGGGPRLIFDTNNDGKLELIHPVLRGYWEKDSTGTYVWQADKFPTTTLDPFTASGHGVPLDYDNDGDLDLYLGQGHYSPVGADAVDAAHGPNVFYPHLFRNDSGTFVEVTEAAGLDTPGLLKNAYYFSTYCASMAADLQNDGWMDIVYGCEQLSNTSTGNRVTFLLNNGDGTFSVDRTSKFDAFRSSGNSAGRPWTDVADYDNDGLLDILKTETSRDTTHESTGLYRNTTVTSNHYLRARAQCLLTDCPGVRFVLREVGTATILGSQQTGPYNTSNAVTWPHFGLGEHAAVDVDVHFPNGGPTYTFDNVAADQDIIVRLNGEIVAPYIPGVNPIHVAATGNDQEEPPEEPPVVEPTIEELQILISDLQGQIEAILAEKALIESRLADIRATLEEILAQPQ